MKDVKECPCCGRDSKTSCILCKKSVCSECLEDCICPECCVADEPVPFYEE